MDDDDAEGLLGQSDDTISMQLGRSSQPRAGASDPSDLDATAVIGDDYPSPPPPVTINRAPSGDDAYAATPTPEVAAGAATTVAAGAPVDDTAYISGGNIPMTGNSISGDNSSLAGNSFTVTGGLHSPLPQTSPHHGTSGSLPFGVGQPFSGLHTPGSGLISPYSNQGGYTPTGGIVDAPALDDQAFIRKIGLDLTYSVCCDILFDVVDILFSALTYFFFRHTFASVLTYF